MYSTYHLNSANEVDSKLLDAIKATYQSKPITIVVKESVEGELSPESKAILDERLLEDDSTYLDAKESLVNIKKKYSV